MSTRVNKPDTEADITLRECLKSKTSFVMVAGAGSGKTTSLIKALKYIDDTEGMILRQQGKRVACITYTTGAEHEILADVGHDLFFHVSTIHSFLWELIRPFQPNIKSWVIEKIKSKLQGFKDHNLKSGTRQATKEKNLREIKRYEEIANLIAHVKEFTYETGSNYSEGILGHSDIVKMVPELIKNNGLLQSVLVEKYPYFFIDESQDTIPDFINAMKIVDHHIEKFCLGFFGDPMQRIYLSGAATIILEPNWKEIKKPENFRCPTSVLDVINQIRSGGDTLEQTGGRKEYINGKLQSIEGTAHLFILLADEHREVKIQKVREYIARKNNDPLWISEAKEADLKVLLIEHRMAANRLNFPDLFAAFKDKSVESLSSGFSDGTCWALQPFQRYLLPLAKAVKEKNHFEVIELLRQYCPQLQKSFLKISDLEPKEILLSLQKHTVEISKLVDSESTATIKEVLLYANANNMIQFDERIAHVLKGESIITLNEDEEDQIKINDVLAKYFICEAKQLWGYQIYIHDKSPYSTQHSIKGAEFNRVIVVLDDEEGAKSTLYSYEKLLGVKGLSDTDKGNIRSGIESTLDRTRRLFYVCCSRALKDLIVILFVSNGKDTFETISASNLFGKEFIKTDDDLK